VAVVALLTVGGCSPTVPLPSADKRILEIDNQSIYLDEFQQYLHDALGEEEVGPADLIQQTDAATLSRLFDQFVEEQLLLQQALKSGVQVSDAELQEYLEMQGLSDPVPTTDGGGKASAVARDRFQVRVRRTLMMQRFKDEVILRDVRVTPEEIEKFFSEHPEEFQGSSRVVLRQILVDEEPLARRIRADLEQGASFQELGERHTLAPDRAEPRQYEEADLPEEIQAVVNSLKPGETSGVVNIGRRYRLFHLEARQGKSLQTLDDVRDQIEFVLLRRMTDEVMRTYLDRLRSQVAIHVYHDNLPFVYETEESS
jgi:parvulin-like peptidyl-prolyl isomerase